MLRFFRKKKTTEESQENLSVETAGSEAAAEVAADLKSDARIEQGDQLVVEQEKPTENTVEKAVEVQEENFHQNTEIEVNVTQPVVCDFEPTDVELKSADIKVDDKADRELESEPSQLHSLAVESVDEVEAVVDVPKQVEASSWLHRLKSGLSKSSDKIGGGITDIFTKRKLDDETLESLEELLIMADIGAKNAMRITENLAKTRYEKEISDQEIKQALADEISAIVAPVAMPLRLASSGSPQVILMVGVNGNGKTTTIGKLAKQFLGEGKSVMLCAADTFRAAAVEQLQVWGERNNVAVVTGAYEADAASVAYTALERAKAENSNVLMIDTAGRLQNKSNLMEELKKIIRVIQKIDPLSPHHILLTLDATTGQNAISQAKSFQEIVGVNGLIVTKLDGSAKAGVVVALAEQFKLPIHAIGIGEGIDDLRPFHADEFAQNLVGIAVPA